MTSPVDIAAAHETVDPLPTPVTAWDRVIHAFLLDYFAAMPVHGTVAGYHLSLIHI